MAVRGSYQLIRTDFEAQVHWASGHIQFNVGEIVRNPVIGWEVANWFAVPKKSGVETTGKLLVGQDLFCKQAICPVARHEITFKHCSESIIHILALDGPRPIYLRERFVNYMALAKF